MAQNSQQERGNYTTQYKVLLIFSQSFTVHGPDKASVPKTQVTMSFPVARYMNFMDIHVRHVKSTADSYIFAFYSYWLIICFVCVRVCVREILKGYRIDWSVYQRFISIECIINHKCTRILYPIVVKTLLQQYYPWSLITSITSIISVDCRQ